MKRLVSLALVLTMAFALCACAVYRPPVGSTPSGSGSGSGGSGGGIGGTGTGSGEGDPFTVTLVIRDDSGELVRYYPQTALNIQAAWTGSKGMYQAPFGADGVASVTGPDGEYRVTLLNLPDTLTYDCNSYNANSLERDVQIELLRIISTNESGGSALSHGIVLLELGTYRAILKSRSDTVYYWYKPTSQGRYEIESWADVTVNEINPIMNHHNGTRAYQNPSATVYNDGGTSSTFTKNFRFQIEASADMVSESIQGNIWIFGVHADCLGDYPIAVDFTITFRGDYVRPDSVYEPVPATGPFMPVEQQEVAVEDVTKIRYIYEDNDDICDDTNVSRHDDGFYYYIDHEGAEHLVYAMINKDSQIIQTEDGTGFLFVLIKKTFGGHDYNAFMDTYDDGWCNEDGGHPLNDELKLFLFEYAKYKSLYDDGEGYAENYSHSNDENVWLFNCYYLAPVPQPE